MRKITPGGSPSKSTFQYGLKAVNPPLPPGVINAQAASDNQAIMRRRLNPKSPDQDSLGHDSSMSIATSDSLSGSVDQHQQQHLAQQQQQQQHNGVLLVHHHPQQHPHPQQQLQQQQPQRGGSTSTFASSSSASSSSSSSIGGGAVRRASANSGSLNNNNSFLPPHPHLNSSKASTVSVSSAASVASVGSSGAASNHDSICSAANVEDMVRCGVPDSDVMAAWLGELGFEEYLPLFAAAGYDMPTVSRMTPEDLTAIGIQNPNHRKRLKSEIGKLGISDGLPNYIPATLEEWLYLLRLTEYRSLLHQQGYRTLQQAVGSITVEDLEDVGIFKLGHQKRFLLGIKRVKELRAAGGAAGGSPQRRSSAAAAASVHLAGNGSAVPPGSGVGGYYQPEVVRIVPPRPTPPPRAATLQQPSSPSPPPLALVEHHQIPPHLLRPQQHQTFQQHPVSASLERLPPPPPPLHQLQHQPLLHQHQHQQHQQQHFVGSYDDSFVSSSSSFHPAGEPTASSQHSGGRFVRPAGGSSTFLVSSNSPHQWGTLPRAFRHNQHHQLLQQQQQQQQQLQEQLQLDEMPPPPAELLSNKPVAKVPAYPRPAASAQQQQPPELPDPSDQDNWGKPEKNQQNGATPLKKLPKNPKCLQRSGESLSADDVLDDIGSMLADLTDELDAMLHSDKP